MGLQQRAVTCMYKELLVCFCVCLFLNLSSAATFVYFASFFRTGGSKRQRIREKSRRRGFFIKINEIYVSRYEHSIAQVSCVSSPRGAAGALVPGNVGCVCVR